MSAKSDLLNRQLGEIRIGTGYELSDSIAIATKILKPARSLTDKPTFEFAHSFLVAVILCILNEANKDQSPTLDRVLSLPVDPNWDHNRQIILWCKNSLLHGDQKKTKNWIGSFADAALAMPSTVSDSLMKRSHALWVKALSLTSPAESTTVIAEPPNSVQIFKLAALAGAATATAELQPERRGSAERIIRGAQKNDGYRTLPDPKKAHAILESVKSEFENLIAPIIFLQKNLILSAAMGAKNFRVRPILLLGEPGIGKTYLAMELAKSLGGAMEKVSASGAGFMLNGSQSTWTGAKCGQVFKALAEGETTSPVFILDEIDKMGDDERHPILPVILELLEPGTAAIFKDEFFEMNFDASRIIFVLTANSLNNVPEALRSRVEIFNVPRPDVDQRMRIIKAEMKGLRTTTGQKIQLDKASSTMLANRTDIDMRRTSSIVRDAFVQAIMDNKKTAIVIIPDDNQCRSKIGFLLGDFSTKKPNIEHSRKNFVCSL